MGAYLVAYQAGQEASFQVACQVTLEGSRADQVASCQAACLATSEGIDQEASCLAACLAAWGTGQAASCQAAYRAASYLAAYREASCQATSFLATSMARQLCCHLQLSRQT